jgi:DNA-binding NtrC family response regulator
MGNEHAVLIAEDDEGLRYALTTAFERAGYRVDAAASGREAVQFINENAAGYCGVLLDMLLPNVHGSSVLAHIARVAPKLPVIAVTGYPDRVLFADPADRHIVKSIFVKPVEPADVVVYMQSRCKRDGEGR